MDYSHSSVHARGYLITVNSIFICRLFDIIWFLQIALAYDFSRPMKQRFTS